MQAKRPTGRGRWPGAFALVALVTLVAAPIVLLAAVDLPGTQPSDGTGAPGFPPFMNGTGPGVLTRPGVCDNCHSSYRLMGEPVYEPWDTWSGSMMGNAARDPLFWAALDVANQDDAALGDVGVGDFCIRCHVPKGWYEGRSHCPTAWGEEFDGSCLVGTPDVPDNDFEGVLCHFCHRMYDASNPPAGQFADPLAPRAGNAQVYLSTESTVMRGPFTDAAPIGHTPVYDPFFKSPALCGQCHDVTNPARNRRDAATGADLGYLMPIERTWSEYRASALADAAGAEYRTCQDCHMPAPDHDGDGTPDLAYACNLAVGPRGPATTLEGPMHEHVFAGANTWMLGLLRDEYGASLNRVEKYDAVISMTRRVLAGAVALDVTAPASVLAGDPLLLDVRVTNLAGHKFPTGYPEGRRAWIQIFAGEDANASGSLSPAEITFASGAYDAATGVLTHDPQIVTYEAKLGVFDFNGDGACDTVDDATGREMFHFVLNDCVVSDDRIPPLGFVPTVETAPVGHVYPTDTARPPALVNFDDRAYAIPVPDAARGVFLVETRVLYQSSSREYVEFLRDESRATCDPRDPGCDPTAPDARASRGEKMHDLWESHGRSPPEELVMARSAVFVAVPPPVACCVSGTCEDLAPAECRAREGREEAAGSTCATSPCQRPAPAPAEPSDVTRGDAPVRVLKGAAGVLEVTYDPACDAIDHAAAWTPVSALRARSWPGFSCGHGVSGTLSIDPGPGSFAFVVVGLGAVAEGSYGRDSDGLERPQRIGPSACDMPQDLGASCR